MNILLHPCSFGSYLFEDLTFFHKGAEILSVLRTFETPCLTKLETRARSVKRVFDMIENADTIRESLYFEDKILVFYEGGVLIRYQPGYKHNHN